MEQENGVGERRARHERGDVVAAQSNLSIARVHQPGVPWFHGYLLMPPAAAAAARRARRARRPLCGPRPALSIRVLTLRQVQRIVLTRAPPEKLMPPAARPFRGPWIIAGCFVTFGVASGFPYY